jgi:hypothetical protein
VLVGARGLRLRRDLRRVGPVVEASSAAIAVRTSEASAAVARLEAKQLRLREASDRLRADLDALSVLRAELDRAQADLTVLRGKAP